MTDTGLDINIETLESWLLNPKYLAWLAANEPEGLKRLKVALAKAWLAKYGDTE